jgi:hypothetical protein
MARATATGKAAAADPRQELACYLLGLAEKGKGNNDMYAATWRWKEMHAPAMSDEDARAVLREVVCRHFGAPVALKPTPVVAHAYQSYSLTDSQVSQDLQVSHESPSRRQRGENPKTKSAQKKTGCDPAAAAVRAAKELAARLFALGPVEYCVGCHCEWRYPFDLARCLKAVGGLTRRQVAAAAAFVAEFRARGLTLESLGTEDLCAGALACWDKVKFAEGQDPLSAARELAVASPLSFRDSTGALYDDLAGLAYHLAKLSGGSVIVLPQERIGKLLGKNQASISRTLALLVRDGVLLVADNSYSFERGKAKTYRFVAARGTYEVTKGGRG